MPPINITNTDAVLIDGVSVPTALIRVLAAADLGRIRIECDDGSSEEVEVRREGGGVHFLRDPRSASGTDQKPVETVLRAELVPPNGGEREWVARGSDREAQLLGEGWKEEGRTRGRIARNPTSENVRR